MLATSNARPSVITPIDVEEDHGNAFGYAVSSRQDQAANYLSEYVEHFPSIADWLKRNVAEIAILKNLNVDIEARGNGYGNELLERFLAEAELAGAEVIILIADSGESQLPGFDLERWYQGYGFASVCQTNTGALMVYPEEIGERMLADLFSEADHHADGVR